MAKNNLKNVLIGAAGLAIIVGLFLMGKPSGQFKNAEVKSPEELPGMQTGMAPWTNGQNGLRERLVAIGFPLLASEGMAQHIHQHLDIFIDGKKVSAPADIGIGSLNAFISPVHIHDEPDIIHVESPVKRGFTLGEFFDVWGVKFTQNCIGGYCEGGDSRLKIFSNGELYSGDPRNLELGSRQEIVIAYGADKELPNPIPSTYAFGPGF